MQGISYPIGVFTFSLLTHIQHVQVDTTFNGATPRPYKIIDAHPVKKYKSVLSGKEV